MNFLTYHRVLISLRKYSVNWRWYFLQQTVDIKYKRRKKYTENYDHCHKYSATALCLTLLLYGRKNYSNIALLVMRKYQSSIILGKQVLNLFASTLMKNRMKETRNSNDGCRVRSTVAQESLNKSSIRSFESACYPQRPPDARVAEWLTTSRPIIKIERDRYRSRGEIEGRLGWEVVEKGGINVARGNRRVSNLCSTSITIACAPCRPTRMIILMIM